MENFATNHQGFLWVYWLNLRMEYQLPNNIIVEVISWIFVSRNRCLRSLLVDDGDNEGLVYGFKYFINELNSSTHNFRKQ